MQLQGHVTRFQAAGIGVAALTYDAPDLQRKFIEKFSITYPVLSDVDATSIEALGILDAEYTPGDASYGIPYPGVFVVSPNGAIVGKIFVEGYATRVEAEGVLTYAQERLN